ncbi:adenylate/guanylate cyclase domain-containing protein [Vineibacter terrae]|uniref:Adenylate/guanylate cyclase domain-containing protein n=1 Tax=Vineibacter terrae TaxID=2586908 RepID=A0A5C8PGQ0_9HYPH|nr:adenylate/guanylate cyclase domain-containing protein [Vineibacter terrae]TXL73004.1 adenylate/guanylate cyclase domain-containing protein [Vineibacter terrae]
MPEAPSLPFLQAWLIAESLRGCGDTALMQGFCERLLAQGVPVFRVFVGSDVLHPTLAARTLRWRRGSTLVDTDVVRGDGTDTAEAWRTSPFFAMIEQGSSELRVTLDDPARIERFPVLPDLKQEGGTDYLALMVPFGGMLRFGQVEEIYASFATDRAGGFRDQDIATLRDVIPALALALHAQRLGIASRTLLDTYLGCDAAERVLAGNIVRGQAEAIHAVIWSSDLSDFTRVADEIPPGAMLAMLNAYAEIVVDAITTQGGDVLKFIGDGILAIFRDEDPHGACGRALDAARAMLAKVDALKVRRRADGLPVTNVTLALHVGEVLYGNFGSATRLDFTVLGPAVNETARIAALSRSLDQRVIVSQAFAIEAGPRRRELVSLGRYALRGVARPQELYTFDVEAVAVA